MRRLVLIKLILMAAVLPASLMLAQAPDAGSGAGATAADRNVLLVPRQSRQESLPINTKQTRPVGEGRDQRPISSSTGAVRPETKPAGSQSLEFLSEQFRTGRESILKQRERERKVFTEKLRRVTGREREELINEFREKQRAWLREQKALSEQEFRQRINTLRDEFKNRERDQLLDEVKGKARELRERLGKD